MFRIIHDKVFRDQLFKFKASSPNSPENYSVHHIRSVLDQLPSNIQYMPEGRDGVQNIAQMARKPICKQICPK